MAISSAERFQQAVVVIHGIGEQRPMTTLRSFVDSVLDAPAEGPRFYSKPDRLSELFELRRLQNRQRPRTHFYEYYWAYHAEGTKFMHVASWAYALLWRRPSRVPKHLLPLYGVSWLILLGVAIALASGPLRSQAYYVGAALTALWFALQTVILSYVGDAARYLSPLPANITLRNRIRAEGLKLLRKLHDEGKYQRIIVVGHSLGSVIAYDILKHLWIEVHDKYTTPEDSEQPALAKLEEVGEQTRETARLGTYPLQQEALGMELRELGMPWRVTDFITLGSPLAHAAVLLADDEANLRARQAERELPTCPPEPELTLRKTMPPLRRYAYRAWTPFEGEDGEEVTLRVLHHAALFAITKWTNLYFPARLGLFGDFVGGPLAPVFGYGIRDRAVRGGTLASLSPGIHLRYWRDDGDARASLREALNLGPVAQESEEPDVVG